MALAPNVIDTYARTIWGEARGEGELGMQAVANVIYNRVQRSGWWGSDIVGVCRKPWQFSCWNDNDPNKEKLLNVTESDEQFKECLSLASRAVDGELPDLTNGSDSYFDCRMPKPPSWAANASMRAVIGHHIFFKTRF